MVVLHTSLCLGAYDKLKHNWVIDKHFFLSVLEDEDFKIKLSVEGPLSGPLKTD